MYYALDKQFTTRRTQHTTRMFTNTDYIPHKDISEQRKEGKEGRVDDLIEADSQGQIVDLRMYVL